MVLTSVSILSPSRDIRMGHWLVSFAIYILSYMMFIYYIKSIVYVIHVLKFWLEVYLYISLLPLTGCGYGDLHVSQQRRYYIKNLKYIENTRSVLYWQYYIEFYGLNNALALLKYEEHFKAKKTMLETKC